LAFFDAATTARSARPVEPLVPSYGAMVAVSLDHAPGDPEGADGATADVQDSRDSSVALAARALGAPDGALGGRQRGRGERHDTQREGRGLTWEKAETLTDAELEASVIRRHQARRCGQSHRQRTCTLRFAVRE
jgi:hypothetical protein